MIYKVIGLIVSIFNSISSCVSFISGIELLIISITPLIFSSDNLLIFHSILFSDYRLFQLLFVVYIYLFYFYSLFNFLLCFILRFRSFTFFCW
ncbi:hypothetical protein H8356DRAFT_451254 [Neocallimastix lanati (nom. inval.)]|uniref:Uncharacterized protein n=1 Tax=Neocallimastix californiae TaxID=1754190 RepID=A0A1Y2DKK3_9FUNG|nr:hypothetical protein H8356DRAFT_451254 [Neocallimastix sp. JGI-2020a]ORY59808.1 hypothetical protein LY90DRAFT_244969 [Neocallimastix californiae]|eukprot:ORY59808.1 hypothetical protein LY90DRAFT_244969 [Neocallimastix californiae]